MRWLVLFRLAQCVARPSRPGGLDSITPSRGKRGRSGARKCLLTRPGHVSGVRNSRGGPAVLTEDKGTGVFFLTVGATVAILSPKNEPKNDSRNLIFGWANSMRRSGHSEL